MTYEDPKTGRERNLGQDNIGGSMWSWIGGVIIVAAIAFGGWYYYDHGQKLADQTKANSSLADNSNSAPNSGPGVQGASGGTNGPAAKEPEGSSASGASSGSSGTGGNVNQGTQPSQDLTGVKGAPGGTNGPADTSKP